MRPLLALSLLILAFVTIFILFVMSSAPGGIIDFAPPNGNFTGTTTITTAYGYICEASHITQVESPPANVTTLSGIGIVCYQAFSGILRAPIGPEIFALWLVA